MRNHTIENTSLITDKERDISNLPLRNEWRKITEHTLVYKFIEFMPALEFLRQERKNGNHAIYYPGGGDNPRKLTTDPAEHFIIVTEQI